MKVLLHACCGPCLTTALTRLDSEGFDISVLYFNPNTYPFNEWEKRKVNIEILLNKFNNENNKNVSLICPDYNPDVFKKIVTAKHLEDKKEGGERCFECIKLRMAFTARYANIMGFDAYTTSLSVSPHKNYDWIKMFGDEFASIFNVKYIDRDFKKKNGFLQSVELSKEYGLYRQIYCGCKYSLNTSSSDFQI